ncbi:hypothetical protein [Lactobacillus juensis]|uniref:hypothetical protein n=1 Tax=Lactobacillus juensis TaxID=3082862 RepID=UPI0030C6EA32
MTDMNKLDDKFIQIVMGSNNLLESLCVLSNIIVEIDSPSDLTLTKLNQISALTKVIKNYARQYDKVVVNAYSLFDYGED